ncbi:MAG: P-loop NTPase [Kiritimatiellaeota bacterium]|nr:P-loop NTPase [Kiritimatiellota bacterium]
MHSYKGGVGKTTFAVLLAAAFAQRKERVCLVDLDLLAPALTGLVKVQGDGIGQRGTEGRYDVGDFLFGRYDERRQQCFEVKAEQACHLAGFPWPGAEHLKVHLVPARADFDLAVRAQSYLLAEVRSRVLEARIEFMLEELQRSREISLFVLDVPPSLFGTSDAVRRLVEEKKGALVQISTPTQADLIGTREMLSQMLAERPPIGSNKKPLAKRNARPTAEKPPAALMTLVVNRCPWGFSSATPRVEVMRIVGRALAQNDSAGRNRRDYESLAERMLENFQEVAVIQESEHLARLSRVPMREDEIHPALGDLLDGGLAKLADRLLDFFGVKVKL